MVPEGRRQAGAEKLTYLPLEATTISERLKNEAGYATGFVGKWHLSHQKGKDGDGNPLEPQLRPEFQGYYLNIGSCDRGGPPGYFEPYRIPALEPRKDGEYLPTRLADECISFLEANREKPFFRYPNYAFHKQNRLGGAIRKGKYKLIRFYDDDPSELYDLESDISEKNDLSDSNPEVVRRLTEELLHWLKSSGAKMPVPAGEKG